MLELFYNSLRNEEEIKRNKYLYILQIKEVMYMNIRYKDIA